jgi:hypothetical protein
MRTKAEATATDDNSQVFLRATKPDALWSACHYRTRRWMIERLARRAARCVKRAGGRPITLRGTPEPGSSAVQCARPAIGIDSDGRRNSASST